MSSKSEGPQPARSPGDGASDFRDTDAPRPQLHGRTGYRQSAVIGPVAAFLLGVLLNVKEAAVGHLSLPAELGVSAAVLVFVFWTVFVVLRHAEAIALRVGEPYGTLVLTLAVTAIEASIIVSVMLEGEPNPALARESVFSTVMIVCGGMLGICLGVGGWRHGHQELKRQGTSALLAVVVALSILTLVLPNFTLTAAAGSFSHTQLIFVSTLCLLLYASFLFNQTTRHRNDFIDDLKYEDDGHHMAPSDNLVRSGALLGIGLVGIVLLAEYVAGGLEDGLETLQVGRTDPIVGAFIAALVLTPETVAAIRASVKNELQRSLNIALGSACATIGLTVPVVAAASLVTGSELTLGLEAGDMVLLLLVLSLSIISFGTGRTTGLTGAVHFVVFVAYLMLIAVP